MSASEDFKIIQDGVGLFVLPEAVLRFQGPDVREFLQGAISNDIKELKKGRGLAAFHLTPKGKWIASFKLFDREDGLWALTSPAESKALEEGMKTLLLFSKTQLKNLTEEYVWIAVVGEKALSYAAQIFQWKPDLPPLSHQFINVDGILVEVIRDFDRVFPTFLLLSPREDLQRIKSALSSPPLPYPAQWLPEEMWNTLRIEAKIPLFGVDVDEKTLPPEAGLDEGYISYTKGCYVGQEIISRLKHYGQVKRQLTRLKMEGMETLPPQAAIFYEGKEVGKVSSVAFSPRLGATVALALLPTDLGEVGKVVRVKTDSEEFEAIVM